MAAEQLTGIYEIVNSLNGKRYVGSAVNMPQRWRQHRRRLHLGTHHSKHLQKAWSKYGAEAFEFRIIMQCERRDLLRFEQSEIDSSRPDYNVCLVAGSTLGRMHSAETRQKISGAKVGLRMPPRSAEHRAKLSAAHLGKQKSKEHAAALQAGRRRRKISKEENAKRSASLVAAYASGLHRRDRPSEYREKIANALKGRSLTPEHRANVAAAMSGKKRGPYKLDPAKSESKRQAGLRLAVIGTQRRLEKLRAAKLKK